MKALIEFEGKTVKPNKNGEYKCPFNCGHTGYPVRKWKTEKGFRRHMNNCSQRPSLLRKRKETNDSLKIKALSEVTKNVGQVIFYIHEIIVKPTHIQRGNRMQRIRYEAVKKFAARTDTIKTINYYQGQGIYFNDGIRETDICETMENAETLASIKQKQYDDHCRFSEMCR